MCKGDERLIGYFDTAQGCANACRGTAQMFAYGTDKYGVNRCWHSDGCTCYCQYAATNYECNKQITHDGYNLYKYQGVILKLNLPGADIL